MNIGIFSDTYLPQVNGVVSSIVTLEKQLRKQGHNVYIFTISHPKAQEKEANVYRLPSMPFVFLKDHRVGLLYSPKLVHKIKKLKLDIILSQTEFSLGFFARLVSKQLHIPIVHTYHTMYEEYMHYISKGVEFSPEFARKYSKMFCNHVDGIVAPTAKTKDLLLSYGVKKPIEVIPTGIDFSPFNPSSYTEDEITTLRQEFGLTKETPVILFVGRVAKEKSIDIIFQALPKVIKALPEAKMLLVGDGPELINLKKLAAKLGLTDHIIFAGMRPWSQIGKYYQLGNVFVSASVSETQGLTFAEAMAATLPVIAKVDESIQGLVENDVNGKLFETVDELSDALIRILSDEAFRKQLADQALTSVAPLSDEIFGENALLYYQRILALSGEAKSKKNKNTKKAKKSK
ncbi:MAG: glycosyltransferase family 4 protein [Cellulosilyticaceae bacterium]